MHKAAASIPLQPTLLVPLCPGQLPSKCIDMSCEVLPQTNRVSCWNGSSSSMGELKPWLLIRSQKLQLHFLALEDQLLLI